MATDRTPFHGMPGPATAVPAVEPGPVSTASPLLEESPTGGIPLQTARGRAAGERAYDLFSAAISACTARGLRDRAAALLEEEARLPFLTPEEAERVGDDLDRSLAELRAGPVPDTGAEAGPLSEADLADLFDLGLRGRLTGTAREHPRVLLFGGQPGAGRSTVQRLLLPVLPEGTVSYDGDDLMRLSPHYERAMLRDDRSASQSVAAHVGALHDAALEHILSGRSDVLCNHPMGRADQAAAWVRAFREAGYRVEVAFLAVHASVSRRAIVERYRLSRERRGSGRWVPEPVHDRLYQGVPNTVEFLETHRLVDSLYVLSRDGEVLYADHLGADGRWRSEPFGRIALEAQRGRRELWCPDDAAVPLPTGD